MALEMETVNSERCRICLAEERIMLPLYDRIKLDKDVYFANVINRYCEIQVTPNDMKPQVVCKECADTTEVLLEFKRTCEESEVKLNFELSSNTNMKYKSSKCRICLSEKTNKLSLNDKIQKDKDVTFASILNKFLDIQVSPDDSKPQLICPKCAVTLKTLTKFKSKCNETDVLLTNKALNSLKMETPEGKFVIKGTSSDDKNKTQENGIKKELSQKLQNNLKPDCRSLSNNQVQYFACKFCDYLCKTPGNLNKHFSAMHADKAVLLTSKSKRQLQQHNLKSIKNYSETKTMISIIKCKICKKSFLTKSSLRNHKINVHGRNITFACMQCLKSFKNEKTLKQHKRIHRSKAYCEFCETVFKTPSMLEEHFFKFHRKREKNLSNTIEEILIFKNSSDFNEEKGIQISTNPLEDFNNPQIHMCMRNNEIPNLTLKRKGRRLFICIFCGESYIKLGNLKTHKFKVHQADQPVCIICKSVFETISELETHFFQQHDFDSVLSNGLLREQNKKLSITKEDKCTKKKKKKYNKRFICECHICGCTADFDLESFNQHIANHPKCKYCNIITKDNLYLEKHIEEDHQVLSSLEKKKELSANLEPSKETHSKKNIHNDIEPFLSKNINTNNSLIYPDKKKQTYSQENNLKIQIKQEKLIDFQEFTGTSNPQNLDQSNGVNITSKILNNIKVEPDSSEYEFTEYSIQSNEEISENLMNLKADKTTDQCLEQNETCNFEKVDIKTEYMETDEIVTEIENAYHTSDKNCNLCGFFSGKAYIMRNHKLKVHGLKKCRFCEFWWYATFDLNKHINEKHFDKGFTCKVCKKVFLTEVCVYKHIERAHNHKCRHCSLVFETYLILKQHVMTVHRKLYMCVQCGESFRSSEESKMHGNAHTNKLTCEICQIDLKTPANLAQHFLNKHKPLLEKTGELKDEHEEVLINEMIKTDEENTQIHNGSINSIIMQEANQIIVAKTASEANKNLQRRAKSSISLDLDEENQGNDDSGEKLIKLNMRTNMDPAAAVIVSKKFCEPKTTIPVIELKNSKPSILTAVCTDKLNKNLLQIEPLIETELKATTLKSQSNSNMNISKNKISTWRMALSNRISAQDEQKNISSNERYKKGMGIISIFRCKICSAQFERAADLGTHFKELHKTYHKILKTNRELKKTVQ